MSLRQGARNSGLGKNSMLRILTKYHFCTYLVTSVQNLKETNYPKYINLYEHRIRMTYFEII